MKLYLSLLQIYYKFKKRLIKPKTTYIWNRTNFYKKMWEEAANELSAHFSDLGNNFWQVSKNDHYTRINLFLVELDDPVKLDIAGDKPLSYKLLAEQGLSIPEHLCFNLHEVSKMEEFINSNPGYFVVKPANGTSSGMGVTTHLKNYKECVKAAVLASLYCSDLIIERLIPGECYRLLFLNGKMIHASRRAGINITGDGKSTIHQLFHSMYDLPKNIYEDRDYVATLAAQNLKADSIISANETILVKSINNFSKDHSEIRTEYDEEATKDICQEIINEAAQAVNTIRSKFMGVDIITFNPALPLKETGGVIGELNTTPGLHHHYNLSNNGKTTNPALEVLDYLLNNQWDV